MVHFRLSITTHCYRTSVQRKTGNKLTATEFSGCRNLYSEKKNSAALLLRIRKLRVLRDCFRRRGIRLIFCDAVEYTAGVLTLDIVRGTRYEHLAAGRTRTNTWQTRTDAWPRAHRTQQFNPIRQASGKTRHDQTRPRLRQLVLVGVAQ